MDPVLPFRILSPGTRKPKFTHRVKDSKLSLKSRMGTHVQHVSKENKDPKLTHRKNQKRTGLRFEDSDLMTSDESDTSIERYSQPHSVFSINTQESTFSVPVAESTRCELPSMKFTSESTTASLHTANNDSNSSASTEYFTAYPLPVGCDESIICISDSSPEPERKILTKKNRLAESVLISSDESDNEPSCGLQFTPTKKTLSETVDLESSSSDVDHSDDEENVVIPPSVKSDDSSFVSSVSSAIVKTQFHDAVIPPSPDRSSQSDIISEDSYCEKGLSKASAQRREYSDVDEACDSKAISSKTSSSFKKSHDCDFDESSWKKDFRLVLPESQSNDSDKLFKSMEAETKTSKPSHVTQTISKEKYDDIARWIIGGRTTSESSVDSLKVPSSLVEKTNSPLISDNRIPRGPQVDRPSAVSRASLRSDSEDDDNFHALLESVRKKRMERQEEADVKDNFVDDSFIDDCRSDVAESPSFNVYHSDLTKSIKAEVKSVKKTVDSLKKKHVFRNLYKSDELSEDDATTSPISKPKACFKAIVYASNSEDSETDFEISTKGEKKPGSKKSDQLIKQNIKHYSDDSAASWSDTPSGRRNRRVGSSTRKTKGSLGPEENTDSDDSISEKPPKSKVFNWRKTVDPPSSSSTRKTKGGLGREENTDSDDCIYKKPPKSEVFNWRKTVDPPCSSSGSSNSSSKSDLPKKRSKKFHEKKPVPKTSTASAALVTPKNVAALKSSERPYSPIRTFLSSLSGPTHEPGVRDHPEAAVYNKNFKGKKEELTRRLFKLFNREVFDRRLPDDMLLEWNARLVRTAGLCYCKLIRKNGMTTRTSKIALSTKVITSPDRLRDTLIHEMCHAAVWLLNNESGGHGPFWKAWAQKAMQRFPELPPIERCHTYNIETKFTYKCTKCGYSFGRHSKSLDLDKKRCGYCYGRFEVFLSSQVQEGQTNQGKVLKTPRAPNAFALFVKENYGIVKQGNAQLKHGDIMKKLSENFSCLKVKASD